VPKLLTADKTEIFATPLKSQNMGTIIELADLLKDVDRVKGKVRPTLVMNFEKAGFFTLPREKDKGFI